MVKVRKRKGGKGGNGKSNLIPKAIVLPMATGMALMAGDNRWQEEEYRLFKNDKREAKEKILKIIERKKAPPPEVNFGESAEDHFLWREQLILGCIAEERRLEGSLANIPGYNFKKAESFLDRYVGEPTFTHADDPAFSRGAYEEYMMLQFIGDESCLSLIREEELVEKEKKPLNDQVSKPRKFRRNRILVLVNLTPKKFRNKRNLPKGRGVLVQPIAVPSSYHQAGIIPQRAAI